MRKVIIALLLLSIPASQAWAGGVVINEVQSSNDQTCIDENGESGDWIELYNGSAEDVDLAGWGLSDKAKKPFKWVFPTNIVIKAGGHLMVFADGTGGTETPGSDDPAVPSVLAPTNDALKANLVCWLKADDLVSGGASSGSAVATWSDASGKGNNASNSTSSQRPKVYSNVVNGHAAVRFAASSSQWLGLTKYGFNGMSDMKNVTVVIVGKWSGSGTSTGSSYSKTTYAGLFDVSQKKVSYNAYDTYFQIKQGGVLQLYTGSSSSTASSSSGAVTSGKWCSMAFATNSKNESPKTDIYCDGSVVQSFTPSGLNNSTFVSDSGRMAIGNASCKMNSGGTSVSSSGYFFDGDIAEVIIFNRGLTQDEYVKLYNYIDEKYDLSGKGTGGKEEPAVKVQGIHTSFSLSAEGETLTLTDAASNRVDQIEFGKIPCDASYGRTLDGATTLKWFAEPTPNGANVSQQYEEPVGGVTFTPERGLYETNIVVRLLHDDPEVTIVYTTDHSDPGVNENGVTNGVIYTGGDIAVTKTTVIRATALKAGHLPWKNITTHSYLYLSGVADQTKPSVAADKWTDEHYCSYCKKVVSGDAAACPACYGISKTFVSDAASRAKLVEALKAAPIVSITLSDEEMFDPDTGLHSHPESLDIDRFVSVEWLNATNCFGVTAGLCTSGGWARQFEITPKKSFRLKFRGRFGTSKLEEPVLSDVGCSHTGFKNLVLRGENNQSWGRYSPKGTSMADQIIRDVQGEMSGYHASGSHVQLFINGLYWGLYNVCEYADADWATDIADWGGIPEDYDVLKHGLSTADIPGMEVRDGTADAYMNLVKYVQSCASDSNVTQDEYTNICAKVDIDAYIDYFMLQSYIGNQDWPNNNWVCIMSEKAGVPLRYIAWDVEYALFSTSINRLTASADSSYKYTSEKIQRALEKSAEYKLRFADRVHKHFYNGGALTTESLKARYEKRAEWIRKAIFGEVARWGAYYHDNYSTWTFGVHYVELSDGYKTAFSETTWETEYASIMNFFTNRWSNFKTQLKNQGLYPSVEAAEFTTKDECAGATLSIPSSTTVYYTTDGSDPRVAFTGAVAGSAKTYSSGATIAATDADLVVKARAYNSSSKVWSAISEVSLKAPLPVDTIKGSYPTGLTLTLEEPMELKLFDATFGGPLKITGANVTLVLQAGATAVIPEIDATGCAVTVDGTGTLEMSGASKLIACAGLVVSNGTLKLSYTGTVAKSMAVELTGSYIQYGGDVTMDLQSTEQVFGFYSNTPDVEAQICGGMFSTTIDGGDGSATFKMNKGSNDVKLKGGEISVKLAGTAPRFINTDGKLDIDGAEITVKTLKDDSDNPLGAGARVFKSAKTLEVKSGLVTGSATGEGSEMFSSDKKIVVSGGIVSVEASDDCFSGAENITVSGGKVHALSTAGDALDSNGNMVISGGYVFAFAKGVDGEGLDVDPKTGEDNGIAHTLVISGGTVVAVGYDSVMHTPDEGSINCYTNSSMSSNKEYVEIVGLHADGSKTITTVNWGERHADKFSLITTCSDFIGSISETDDKPSTKKEYIKKLDDDIKGVFLTTLIVLPIVAEEEEEPGSGAVPAGNVSRFDGTATYDGVVHTLNTNALVDAVSESRQGIEVIAIEYATGDAASAPTSGWSSSAPAFSQAGEYIVWYKISAPGYVDFLHAAKVTITTASRDLSKVAWDYTAAFTYDGKPHGVALTGVPSGVAVEYANITNTAADSYTASAHLTAFVGDYAAVDFTTNLTWKIEPRTGVIVTVVGNCVTNTYDGAAHTAKGYKITDNSDLYDTAWVKFTGTDSVTKTAAGTYPIGLKESYFVNTNKNFTGVTFKVTDGELVINKASRDLSKVAWDYTAAFTYDGKPHGVALTGVPSGVAVEYANITNTAADSYTASAHLTASAGDYAAVDCTTNLTWKIGPRTGVIVTVVGNCVTNTYDGAAHTAKGYKITDNSDLYDTAWVKLTGDDSVTKTAAGTYPIGLKESYFANTNKNFTGVTFKLTDGELVIKQASRDLSKLAWDYTAAFTYDGKPHGVVLTGVPSGVAVEYSNITNTAADSYAASAHLTAIAGDYAAVDFTTNLTWKIEPRTGVIVTVIGNCVTNTYDGAAHTAKGYKIADNSDLYDTACVKFTGDDSVTKTAAGTYPIGLKEFDFANMNKNFTGVTFKVTDGELAIKRKTRSDEPGTGEVSEGGVSKFDVMVEYDGEGHTINTNALLQAQDVAVKYAVGVSEQEVGSPWSDSVPVFTTAGTYFVWYRFTEKNYEPFEHVTKLTILPRTGVEVTVIGNVSSMTYKGKERNVTGYEMETSDPLYNLESVVFMGTASVRGTEVGSYTMGIASDQFRNVDPNFDKVTFNVQDGVLTIKNAKNAWYEEPSVKVTSEGAVKIQVDTGSVKFGKVVVTYDDGTNQVQTIAGRHTATFTVAATDSYGGLSRSVTYDIQASAGEKPYNTVEEAIHAGNSEAPVALANPPKMVNSSKHLIVTAEGKSVSVADYYDLTLKGNAITFTLNEAAVPQIPSFDVNAGEDGSKISIETTTRKGLFYSIETGSDLRNLSVPAGAIWVPGDGTTHFFEVSKPDKSVVGAFYRVVVTDVEK